MPIAFCATANALDRCIAQLPPGTACVTIVIFDELPALSPAQEWATIVLEAGSTWSPSYQALIESAVSILAKQGKSMILAPSIVAGMLLALTGLTQSRGAQTTHHICSLRSSQDVGSLLQAQELRLLMLDGDVYAWYEPEQEYLSVNGSGCAVVMLKHAAAGNESAAAEVNVLAPGMEQHW